MQELFFLGSILVVGSILIGFMFDARGWVSYQYDEISEAILRKSELTGKESTSGFRLCYFAMRIGEENITELEGIGICTVRYSVNADPDCIVTELCKKNRGKKMNRNEVIEWIYRAKPFHMKEKRRKHIAVELRRDIVDRLTDSKGSIDRFGFGYSSYEGEKHKNKSGDQKYGGVCLLRLEINVKGSTWGTLQKKRP